MADEKQVGTPTRSEFFKGGRNFAGARSKGTKPLLPDEELREHTGQDDPNADEEE